MHISYRYSEHIQRAHRDAIKGVMKLVVLAGSARISGEEVVDVEMGIKVVQEA